jgi:hypothetical protein
VAGCFVQFDKVKRLKGLKRLKVKPIPLLCELRAEQDEKSRVNGSKINEYRIANNED